jgi:hypothetical protein
MNSRKKPTIPINRSHEHPQSNFPQILEKPKRKLFLETPHKTKNIILIIDGEECFG